MIASPAAGARMYFVQDYEPLFYPAGSHYLLAEATYRLGLHGITAGRWLAQKVRGRPRHVRRPLRLRLRHRHLPARRLARARTGADRASATTAGPSTPRRAHELAMAALELFAEQHPDIEIHLYGERLRRSVPFPATQHGLLTPDELDALYNRCIAGLTLSATNVSLVPHEMLSVGLHPGGQRRRAEPHRPRQRPRPLRPATPFDLAAALGELCERPGPGARGRGAGRVGERLRLVVGRRRAPGRAGRPRCGRRRPARGAPLSDAPIADQVRGTPVPPARRRRRPREGSAPSLAAGVSRGDAGRARRPR